MERRRGLEKERRRRNRIDCLPRYLAVVLDLNSNILAIGPKIEMLDLWLGSYIPRWISLQQLS